MLRLIFSLFPSSESSGATTPPRSWWTSARLCCSSTWSSYWTAGSPVCKPTGCVCPWPSFCTTSCWPPSPGWGWSPSTCTSLWSKSSTPTYEDTSSSSASLDGVSSFSYDLITKIRYLRKQVCLVLQHEWETLKITETGSGSVSIIVSSVQPISDQYIKVRSSDVGLCCSRCPCCVGRDRCLCG